MAWPLVILGAGTALSIYGQYQANLAQAEQELENSIFYEKQAQQALSAQFRQASISAREYEAQKGAQISAYAKGRVNLEGSAAITIAQTLADKALELAAIEEKGRLEYSLAMSRSRQSSKQARTLGDPNYNFMQATATALTSFGGALSRSGGKFGSSSDSESSTEADKTGKNPNGHSGPSKGKAAAS